MTIHLTLVIGEFLLQVFVAGVVLVRKGHRPAVSTAWILAVMSLPIVGMAAYFLVGENRFGSRRAARHARILSEVDVPAVHTHSDPRCSQSNLSTDQTQLAAMATTVSHSPVLCGNQVDLCGDSADNIRTMARDIDAARRHVHLLSYIFLCDTSGQTITEALCRAARRGIKVRLLVDGVGSKEFLQSPLRQSLEDAGVLVSEALPVTMLRLIISRLDIRNHRKLLVVDGTVAWVGSQNIAEANFAPKAKFAPWVDCMLRVEGPLVRELQVIFVEDWFMEREEDLDSELAVEAEFHSGGVAAQAVATGPNFGNETMPLLIQAAIQLARDEIVLTTPYFVPDLPMQAALVVAARRGVHVHLVVPHRNDSWLVQRASRSLYDDLLDAGVHIHEFTGGLLHAKTILIDRFASIITSANLDRRSFEINFELGVLVYDTPFAQRLRALQQGYMDSSVHVDLHAWRQRPMWRHVLEGAAGILSPLL